MDFDFTPIAPVKTAKLSLGSAGRWPLNNPNPVTLEVRHAGDGNPGYVSARMTTPAGKDRIGTYERLAKLYARHIVVGWENVGDVAFSPEAAERYLLALVRAQRTDILDYIAVFCVEAENFHEPIASATDLGKA